MILEKCSYIYFSLHIKENSPRVQKVKITVYCKVHSKNVSVLSYFKVICHARAAGICSFRILVFSGLCSTFSASLESKKFCRNQRML